MAKNLSINLKKLSFEELTKLSARVQKALAAAEGRRKKEALAALKKTAKEFGYSNLDDVVTSSSGTPNADAPSTKKKSNKGAKAPSVARYANPADASQTWTGKGRRPVWFLDALARGVSERDMEIN